MCVIKHPACKEQNDILNICSILFSFYELYPCWIPISGHTVRDIPYDYTTCTYHAVFPDFNALNHTRTDTDPCTFSYMDTSTDIHARRNMAIVIYHTIVVDSSPGIHYTMPANYRTCVNDSAGHHHRSFTDFC